MANIKIPTPLRKFTNGEVEVKGGGSTIQELISDLDKNYPGIKDRILDEQGTPRKFVNIYVDKEDIRFLDGLNTKIKDGDEISIVPAVAGG
ncbi:MAG: molybdopterin synthase sulfur carrier subunit [Candidatus Altiarchaeales archaeon WOR_SM1_79]|nr:MAG: molybdopterin synthase sulfur carrier subunit [Candidatus Altiarchaeales archaeon WOR_SM1_79]